MPTYQYRCRKCSHEFEEFQSISDDPITVCPKCGGETRRVITGGAGINFKGSGFYVTDYKRKESPGSSKESSRDTKSSTPPSSGKESKS